MMRLIHVLGPVLALTAAAAGAQSRPSGQPSVAAAVPPTLSFYATIVAKPGCSPIVLTADPSPAPAAAVGQALDAQIDGAHCSGVIASIATGISVMHYSTVTVRTYTTSIVLR